MIRKTLSLLRSLGKASAIVLPLLLLGIFLAGWWIGRPAKSSAPAAAAGDPDTIWTCSMHPTVRQPGPGLCPICEMDLIQVSSESSGGLRDVKLSADAIARLDVRVAPVVRKPATKKLEFLGKVAPDETNVVTTTARMDGRLDRLYVDYTGISVSEGDHLAEIYSPELFVAQDELISSKRNLSSNADRTRQVLYQAAREKLRLLGLQPNQLDAIESQSKPTDHITLNAPQDGIVLHLRKREGEYVKTGEALYTLADLSSVWVFLEAYEEDLPWLRFAQDVEFQTEALPGKTFTGKIAFIDPVLDETRRITRVRVNVSNPGNELKPGMFVRGQVHSVLAGNRVLDPSLAGKWISPMHPEIIKDGPGECDICGMPLVPANELGFITSDSASIELPLLVPTSAVLRTGSRAVVYRRLSEDGNLVFEGREVVLGPRAGDYFIVESGLREGDLVVTRGAFKIDSELQIMAKPAMMLEGQTIGEISGVEPPVTVAGAWKPVLRTLARAQDDLADKGQFIKHMMRARDIVTAIQPQFLTDDYAPLWREASMKLENVFVQARVDAENESVAAAWDKLLRELPKRAAIAGLDWQLPSAEGMPADQIANLNLAIDAYLPVADLLAHDKPSEALAKSPALQAALSEIPNDTVVAAAKELSEANDEQALKSALKVVTDSLRDIIREGSNDQLGELYLVHCPMAFQNAGADWLSRLPKVENPYYGSRMFSCGDVTETLSLSEKLPSKMPMKDGEDHSGHNH